MNFFKKISICLGIFSLVAYLYLHKQNQVTKVRMKIPMLAKELRSVKEENRRLEFAIEKFESPERLIDLLKTSEYSNLKYPLLEEIWTVNRENFFEKDGGEAPSFKSLRKKTGFPFSFWHKTLEPTHLV